MLVHINKLQMKDSENLYQLKST